jgi:hypothetical protein
MKTDKAMEVLRADGVSEGLIDGFLYFLLNNIWSTYIASLEERERTGQKMTIDKSHPIYVLGDIKRSQYFKGCVEKRVG